MSETQRSVQGVFPTPIHVAKHGDAGNLNKKLSKACYDIKKHVPNSLPEGNSNEHYSTLWSQPNLLDQKEFKDLRSFIVTEVNVFADFLRLDIKNYPLRLNDSWVNIHGAGHSQEPHVHPNHVISGVYYVKAPKNSGDLMLHSPFKMQMIQPPTTEITPYTARTIPVPVEEGVVVLFQSFTEHSVQVNKSNDDRISISFNFLM